MITENELSIIMLTTAVGKTDDTKILTLGEWSKLLQQFVQNSIEPKVVFSSEINQLLEIGYDKDFINRIQRLIDRGASVAFELEEYEKRGIEIVTILNKKYPIMLKRVLKEKKPPVLFCAGNMSLTSHLGIGLVGSRNVTDEGKKFTQELVKKAASERLIVYSGGAKGVDDISEKTAISEGTAAVSFVADSIFSKIKKSEIVNAIADGNMALLSDVKPDIGFSVGRAMGRNKYIYASSAATFVVESAFEKGGTWSGATEAIKRSWGNVFVQQISNKGNEKLIEAGGIPYVITSKPLVELIEERQELTKVSEPAIEESGTYCQLTLNDVFQIY